MLVNSRSTILTKLAKSGLEQPNLEFNEKCCLIVQTIILHEIYCWNWKFSFELKLSIVSNWTLNTEKAKLKMFSCKRKINCWNFCIFNESKIIAFGSSFFSQLFSWNPECRFPHLHRYIHKIMNCVYTT